MKKCTPPGSLKLTYPPTTFDFPGIVTSRAISHNKVELEFYPTGGADIVYKLYINNSTTPITLDTKSLLTVNGGKLLYTVNNLTPDREYKFKLVAENPKTNAISKNEHEAYSRTFDNTDANNVTLNWASPSAGIFSHYELFWRKQSGANFNWGDAIGQAGNNFNYTNYGRTLIDPEETQITLTGFANGEYSFGIITHYTYVTDDGAVIIRSETNNGIKKCVVDNSVVGNPISCTNQRTCRREAQVPCLFMLG